MLFKDGLGSEFKDLRRASYLLLPDGLFIPHFLAHELCSLYGHFLLYCVIPVDPICPLVP